MKQKIQTALKDLETRKGIKILLAVESGSRAWGFESINSDWDVRFLYVHPESWYLTIDDQKETMEEMLPDDLDLSGWELRKALRLFRKSNPPLMEWLKSPIIYQEDYSTAERLRAISTEYFNPKASLHHYFHMGEGNYRDYLQHEVVRTKKYFYVLRLLLACRWIEQFGTFPPMEFDQLVKKLVKDDAVRKEIESLLMVKKSGEEMGEGPRIQILHDFIQVQIEYLKEYLKKESKLSPVGTEKLNELFQLTLREVWGD